MIVTCTGAQKPNVLRLEHCSPMRITADMGGSRAPFHYLTLLSRYPFASNRRALFDYGLGFSLNTRWHNSRQWLFSAKHIIAAAWKFCLALLVVLTVNVVSTWSSYWCSCLIGVDFELILIVGSLFHCHSSSLPSRGVEWLAESIGAMVFLSSACLFLKVLFQSLPVFT